jgi:hypothetical protein
LDAACGNARAADTGSIADNYWFVFVIRNPTTGACDVLFSLSLTSPTMPSGFTQKRRIGTIYRVTGTIYGFQQYGDWRSFGTNGKVILNDGNLGPAQTFLWPATSPGIKVLGSYQIQAWCTSGQGLVFVGDPDNAGGTGTFTITPRLAVPGKS